MTPTDRLSALLIALGLLALPVAPAAAQSQQALIDRTIDVLGAICNGGPGDADLTTLSCTISNNSGGLSGAEEAEAALQVSPREATAANSVATQTTSAQIETERERLEAARVEVGASGPDPDPRKRFGGFLNGFGGFGDVDEHDEIEGYDVSGGGVMAGIDYWITDQVVAGVGFAWSRQDVEYDDVASVTDGSSVGGGDIESDSYTGSLYGSFVRGPIYVDGVLTYTYVDYEFDRPVKIPGLGFDFTASGDTEANQFGVSVGTGYEFQLEALSLGPLAQVDYLQTWIDGYRESGVPGVPLDYDDQDIKSLVTSLGGEASYAISTPFGVVSPYARATWEHEFENDRRDIEARLFVNDTGAGDKLETRTDSPDRDYGRVGGGIAAQLQGGLSLFVDYDTIVGLSDVEYHRFTGGGRIEF